MISLIRALWLSPMLSIILIIRLIVLLRFFVCLETDCTMLNYYNIGFCQTTSFDGHKTSLRIILWNIRQISHLLVRRIRWIITKPPNKSLNATYESKKRKIEIEDKYYRVPWYGNVAIGDSPIKPTNDNSIEQTIKVCLVISNLT